MRKGLALLALVACLLCGCSPTLSTADRSGFALNTVVRVTVYGESESAAGSALSAAFVELERLESLLSATRESSDITRINGAGGAPVTVADETAQLLQLGQQVSTASGGAFDMTVRPLSLLWNFGSEAPAVPDAAALQAACDLVDYRQLTLNGTTVTLPAGGIEPGGIAKGYIADRLRDTLQQAGVTSAVVDLGGNIVALGSKNGADWRIGVKDPSNTAALAAVICGRDFSVVTSGTYERGFTQNGVWYHHLLDPQTGMPVQNGLASVTIVAESSALADALATACFVLGEAEARELLTQFPEAQALFIYEDGSRVATEGLIPVEGAATPEYKFSNFS